jgi:hypothetical protein
LSGRFYEINFTAAVLEKQAKRWTYEEYYKLNDDQRYGLLCSTEDKAGCDPVF